MIASTLWKKSKLWQVKQLVQGHTEQTWAQTLRS